MLNKATAKSLLKDFLPEFDRERERLEKLDLWHGWTQEDIKLPRRTTDEHRTLAGISKTPWLRIVTGSVAQCLHVDGWRSKKTEDMLDADSAPWLTWRANGWDRRQHAVHNATLVYGYSYGRALPGEAPQGGPRSVLRGVSPRKGYAVWQDPAEDDWPMYFLEVAAAPNNKRLVRLYDEDSVHYLEEDDGSLKYISYDIHGSDCVPFVRYGMPDLDGRCIGRVEPFVSTVARMNKTTYDRMLTQHFNSWRVRTISGMTLPEDGTEREKLRLRQEDMLIAQDPETKFGSLPETDLTGLIQSHRVDVDTLAAISQTPTHEFGTIANLSADAIAAARAGLTRNAFEWRTALGAQHTQLLQLAAYQEGHLEDAYDETARVHWQDMEVRSLSQAVDALGKAAEMLGVPVEALWQRIPDVDQDDVEEWMAINERRRQEMLEGDPLTELANRLERQSQGGSEAEGGEE